MIVSHPQVSGLAIDQLTRLAPAPHYVRSITISYAGQPVMSADVDFTISENPSVRFWFVPAASGELRARIEDPGAREPDPSAVEPSRTTTTELVGRILSHAALGGTACGNYGTPFAEVVLQAEPPAVVSLELSSFQLETIATLRPVVAI